MAGTTRTCRGNKHSVLTTTVLPHGKTKAWQQGSWHLFNNAILVGGAISNCRLDRPGECLELPSSAWSLVEIETPRNPRSQGQCELNGGSDPASGLQVHIVCPCWLRRTRSMARVRRLSVLLMCWLAQLSGGLSFGHGQFNSSISPADDG